MEQYIPEEIANIFEQDIEIEEKWKKNIMLQMFSNLKKQTNADRIRNMSDMELAKFLKGIKTGIDLTYGEYVHFDYTIFSSEEQIVNWLQSESEE